MNTMAAVKEFCLAITKLFSSPMAWLLFLAIGSAALVTSGVFVLLGTGWSMISAGCFFMFFAAIIFRGIANG